MGNGDEDGTELGSPKQSPLPPTVSYQNRNREPEREQEWNRQIGRAVENWFRTELRVWKSTIIEQGEGEPPLTETEQEIARNT